MEKKIKLNFILKGIAVFAFVAFCLLAILAGVTLPFVSNASTADCAVLNAESDFAVASADSNTFNPLDYCVKLSAFDLTSTCYGFYFTEEFFNTVKGAAMTGDTDYHIIDFYIDSGKEFMYTLGVIRESTILSPELVNKFFIYNGFSRIDYLTNLPYSYFNPYYISFDGFTLEKNGINSVYDNYKDLVYVFTEIPSQKELIYPFYSRFGYVGNMPSSNMYVNLQEKPSIPDSVRRVTVENTNDLTNGWIHKDWEYFLPLVNSYDGFGNPVDGGFTGWHLINIEVNGVHSSSYSVYFEVLNQRVYDLGTATITNGYVTVGLTDKDKYLVESNFINSENLLVFSKSNNSFKYYLQPNISQNDVYKFFALIDYRNYSPADNDFYVAGYNSASKGYYDNGYNNGFSEGKKVGYNTGFSAGDSQGYARGVESANTYSFLSLFGAIFDAPIQALFGSTQRLPAGTKITDSNGNTITLTSDTIVNRGGMLNFNLMGVNLSGFVLALFSLSILIVVIKFALAKGR